jgi:hypothetical protein
MGLALARIKLLYGPCACQMRGRTAPPGPAGAWSSPAMHRVPRSTASSRRNWNWNGNSPKATLRPLCSGRRTRRATAANPHQRRDPSPLRRTGQVTGPVALVLPFYFIFLVLQCESHALEWLLSLRLEPELHNTGSALLILAPLDASSLCYTPSPQLPLATTVTPGFPFLLPPYRPFVSNICLCSMLAVNRHSGSLNRTIPPPIHSYGASPVTSPSPSRWGRVALLPHPRASRFCTAASGRFHFFRVSLFAAR